jgi:hypothetical protein
MEFELCKNSRKNQTDTGISHFGFYSLSIVGRKKDGEVVKDDEKGRPCRLFRYSSIFQNFATYCIPSEREEKNGLWASDDQSLLLRNYAS